MTRVALVAALLVAAWPPAARGQQQEPAHTHEKQPPSSASDPAGQAPVVPLPAFIVPVTDADRAAVFPDGSGHAMRDSTVRYFVLFDQLEWRARGGPGDFSWDNKGWVGKDRDRFWFRTEGEGNRDRLGNAQVHLLYGRAISTWWDAVVGIRQDVRTGPPQTWAAIGLQGLAPYWFEVEATAYVGPSGRTHLRVETEYELLLTNRLILQPLVELEVYGKSDPARGLGAGLSHVDAGLRLRYEFRREFAPYAGVVWVRKFFGTADLARSAGERSSGARWTVGIRTWF